VTGAVQASPEAHGHFFSVAARPSAFRLMDLAGKERSEIILADLNRVGILDIGHWKVMQV
jgi:hypothetical protein